MSESTGENHNQAGPHQQPNASWPAPDNGQQQSVPQYDGQQYPPPQQGQPQYAQEPYAQDQPPAKKKHTGLIAGLISGGVLLILIIAGVIGFVVIGASHTPQAAATTYLNALKSGDAHKALTLSGTKASEKDPLLTNKAYHAATNRITRFSVRNSKTQGEHATVQAVITQAGKTYGQQFELVKHGKDMLFFDKWELRPVALAKVTVEVNAPSSVSVNVGGVAVKPVSGRIRLNAFPGSYSVAVTGNDKLFTARTDGSSTASVVGFSTGSQQPARVEATPTEAGKQAATDAVNKYIDGCAASTAFKPEGCSFGLNGANAAETYTNVKWTIAPRPVFTIGQWVGSGWEVSTTTPGTANLTGNYSSASSTGTISGGPIDVKVAGEVAVGSSGMTFTSNPFLSLG